MTPPRRFAVHQATHSVTVGDGVTRGLLFTRRLLRELGYDSDIFAIGCPPELRGEVRPWDELPAGGRQILLVHHFIGHPHGAALVAGTDCRILVYHNVTPAEFFAPEDPLRAACLQGRAMLGDWLAPPAFAACLADSPLNGAELEALGYPRVTVLPLLVDLDAWRARDQERAPPARRRDCFTLLFVGRIAPNKGQVELVRLLRRVQDRLGPGERPAELILVGGVSSPDYQRAVRDEIDRLGLTGQVKLTGKIDDRALHGQYRAADCFVCASEHEGFGMPLIEAMRCDLPVIAWDASSVGDTLGGGGVLVPAGDLDGLAEAVVRLARDPYARAALLARQRARLADFEPARLRQRLDAFIAAASRHWCPSFLSESPSRAMKTSVVVCTYNRLATLPATLEALRALRHPELEVVVVNGPSTDGTGDYLDRAWGGRIKRVDCPEANLSRARNLGIQAAAGAIVAFIDDDGIPEPDWLGRALPAFADPGVGAVGGFVRDHTGVTYQSRCIWSDRQGRSEVQLASEDALPPCVPGAPRFPAPMGVNSLFRRAALTAIGGFDEQYVYYLDETDVALRLVDAGWRIRCVPAAEVHHKFAPSHLRSERRVVRDWTPIARSTAYYCIRNAPPGQDLRATLAAIDQQRRERLREIDWAVASGLADDRAGLERGLEEGLRQGIQDAFAHPWRRLGRFGTPAPDWRPLARPAGGVRRLAFVTDLYPPRPCGGVAVFIHQLATALAAGGHEITVITLGEPDRPHTVDWEDGVWVHRLPATVATAGLKLPAGAPPLPHPLASIAAAVLAELDRVDAHRGFEWAVGALWDLNLAAVLATRRHPVALYLVTSYRRALDSKPEWRADTRFYQDHCVPMLAAERWALEQADLILASTDAIRRDTEADYEVSIPPARLALQPFGIRPPLATSAPRPADDRAVRLLYVGRFEARKGIDVLLAILPGLLAAHPRLQVRLIGDTAIPGPDGRTHLEVFQAAHRDAPWRDRLAVSGLVPDDELEQAYADCDLFVAPSRYESFGLIYVEAMRHAKPCVGCRTGGVPEVVLDGETGLLVPPGDAEALRDAIARLIDEPDTRRRLGLAGERRYREHYTLNAFARGFLDHLARADPPVDDAPPRVA